MKLAMLRFECQLVKDHRTVDGRRGKVRWKTFAPVSLNEECSQDEVSCVSSCLVQRLDEAQL